MRFEDAVLLALESDRGHRGPEDARKGKDADSLWSLWKKHSSGDSPWTSYFQKELVGFLKTDTLL